jgi:hypothetical protein
VISLYISSFLGPFSFLVRLIWGRPIACKPLILLRVILTQTGFSLTGTTVGVCDESGLEARIRMQNQLSMLPSVLSCPFYGVPPTRRRRAGVSMLRFKHYKLIMKR